MGEVWWNTVLSFTPLEGAAAPFDSDNSPIKQNQIYPNCFENDESG